MEKVDIVIYERIPCRCKIWLYNLQYSNRSKKWEKKKFVNTCSTDCKI